MQVKYLYIIFISYTAFVGKVLSGVIVHDGSITESSHSLAHTLLIMYYFGVVCWTLGPRCRKTMFSSVTFYLKLQKVVHITEIRVGLAYLFHFMHPKHEPC